MQTFYSKLIFTFIVSLLLISCSARNLDLTPKINSRYLKQVQPTDCSFKTHIFDERRNDTSHFKSFSTTELKQWVGDAFDKIQPEENSSFVSNEELSVHIKKLYISHHGITLSGVIVMKIQMGDQVKAFRGHETATNVWGADYEFNQLLNKSLSKLLKNSREFINQVCHT